MRARQGGPQRGFTLVEMVLVIVVTGIVAAALALFFRPTLQLYLDSRSRAALADAGATAAQRLLRDVRAAVPNSIRQPNSQCLELVPSFAGGRLRLAPDTQLAGSAALDTSQPSSLLDVLSPLQALPAPGDWLVLGNLSPADVYSQANVAAINAVSTPDPAHGAHRLAISPTQFQPGHDSGRFALVRQGEASVFYLCSGADGSLDSQGRGKGALWRLVRGFNAGYPASCPSSAGAQLLASGVSRCNFVYEPNPGAVEGFGYVWLQLELARSGERATLTLGAHVGNAP